MADRDTWELIEGAHHGAIRLGDEPDGWIGVGSMRWRPRPEMPTVQPDRPALALPIVPVVVHVSDVVRTPVGVLMRAVDELSRRIGRGARA